MINPKSRSIEWITSTAQHLGFHDIGVGIIITREPIYRKAKAAKNGAHGLKSTDGVNCSSLM